MKQLSNFAFALLLAAAPALAAQRTVTLSVPGMNCPVCPITVKKALEKVEGVKIVEVDYESRTATVTFDDALTSPARLTRATADAGYPSSVNEVGQ